MPTNSRAVFLSYASQDARAAQRICAALRDAGIEVWFDQSELRGGEAWDRSIRQQIHHCRLFIAIISAHSEARDEGYFRREWKLAVDRTHDMDERKAFLVPVVIDATAERGAHVPEKFHELQWTALPDGETPPAFIERVRRLLSPESASALKRDGPAISPAPSSAAAPRRLIGRKTGVVFGAIAAALLLALGYFALDRFNRSKISVPSTDSIAVLPLANESGEASQQYFSDGISEDLITALSQFRGLKVIGRTSSFQFRDSKEDSRSIGTKLGVAHLLEGSVRRSGDVIRVSAELIDTADGTTQWSERFDRPYTDLFALQDEITHAVAGALRTKLLLGEHAGALSDRPPGGSLEAYNALLEARFYDSRLTETNLHKAIEYFTQATQVDPRYALAWSELSRVWSRLAADFLGGASAQKAFASARETADRALALSPDLAAAHVARGYVLQFADFDWRGAEAEYRRALALAPNDGQVKADFALALAALGQLQPAIDLTRQALATEPLRAEWYFRLCYYLLGLNRLDESERAIRRANEVQPAAAMNYATLTIIEVQRGNAQAALAAAQQESAGWAQDFALAIAREIGGDLGAANAALTTLIERDAGSASYQIAQVYALRNDSKATFEWLDRAWSIRDSGVSLLLYDPFILRFKDDPRFAAFCRKVGLPAPGETYTGNSR